jgi:hypothetical protein
MSYTVLNLILSTVITVWFAITWWQKGFLAALNLALYGMVTGAIGVLAGIHDA